MLYAGQDYHMQPVGSERISAAWLSSYGWPSLTRQLAYSPSESLDNDTLDHLEGVINDAAALG